MARKKVIELVDDLDGEPIESDGQTIRFSYQGVEYEIDLRQANVEKLDELLAPYLSAARRTGGRRTTRAASAASIDKSQLADIRQWARDNGYEVSDRGRISREVQEAYQQAH